MKIRWTTLTLLLGLATPLWAREKTDVVVMKNGDHLTCEIKALNAGTLYLSLDYVVQTISLDWSKVERLESKQLFLVKTTDGSVYRGTLDSAPGTAGRPIEIKVLEADDKEATLSQNDLVQMGETSEKFLQRFNGAVNSGINYSKGNQSVQYNFGAQVEYLRERWSAQANLNSTLASSSGASASARNQVVLSSIHLLPWNNWFYSGLSGFLQSSEEQISLQTTVGGGIGRYLQNTNRASVSVLAGFAWQNTSYTQSIPVSSSQQLTAGLLAADVKLFRFNKTNLSVDAMLLPALSEPGRLQFNTNATYYIKIYSNLTWNLSFYGNWDNQPPPKFSGSDYGTSSGLAWTFGIR